MSDKKALALQDLSACLWHKKAKASRVELTHQDKIAFQQECEEICQTLSIEKLERLSQLMAR